MGIKALVDGLMNSGAMPGGVKYSNDENTLFVGGLPSDTTDLDLFWIFSPFGPIAPKGVYASLTEDKSRCKGIGFVNFMDPNATYQAIKNVNGNIPQGHGSRVREHFCRRLARRIGRGWAINGLWGIRQHYFEQVAAGGSVRQAG